LAARTDKGMQAASMAAIVFMFTVTPPRACK